MQASSTELSGPRHDASPRRYHVGIPGIAAAALLLLAGCGNGSPGARPGPAGVPVVTATVAHRSVPIELHTVGTVEPIASVAIVTRVDGAITRVLVHDGQEVVRGQPLFEVDHAPYDIALRSARAVLARDSAQLDNAESRLAHGPAVFAQGFISKEALTQLETDRASAAAAVDADRAAVDKAALDLDYATLRAPIAGKIGHIALQVGNFVRAAAAVPLTTLNALAPIDVAFAVAEENTARVRAALAAGSVPVSAHPDQEDAAAPSETGELTSVDNAIDAATGTIRLRARFANHDHALWPGQFVVVRFTIGTDEDADVVPAAAIQQGPAGPYVFVVTTEQTAELRPVVLTRQTPRDAVVTGVRPGERVVVDGQSRLTPGARVVEGSAKPGAASAS